MPVNEYRVPFGGDENIPKVDSVDGYSSLNILKNTVYLKGVCFINEYFISIKLLLK